MFFFNPKINLSKENKKQWIVLDFFDYFTMQGKKVF